MLVREDYEKIEQWLKEKSVKDTQFERITEYNDDTLLPVVHENKNALISFEKVIDTTTDRVIDHLGTEEGQAGFMSSEEKVNLKNLSSLQFVVRDNTGESLRFIGNSNNVSIVFPITRLINGSTDTRPQVAYIPEVTNSTAGVMIPSDKEKLNIIDKDIMSALTNNKSYGYVYNIDPNLCYVDSQKGFKLNISRYASWTSKVTQSHDVFIPFASSIQGGLMSSSDKKKLDTLQGISGGSSLTKEEQEMLNNIVSSGCITLKTPTGLITNIDEEKIVIQYDWLGNMSMIEHITAATSERAGLMTAKDKQKLDSLSESTGGSPLWTKGGGNYSLHTSTNIAAGNYAIATGQVNSASGEGSFVTNYNNTSRGKYSFATGFSNKTNNYAEAVFGYCSKSTPYSSNTAGFYGDEETTLFSIGNGGSNTVEDQSHNAFEVKQSGDIYIPNTYSEGKWYEKPMMHLQEILKNLRNDINALNSGGSPSTPSTPSTGTGLATEETAGLLSPELYKFLSRAQNAYLVRGKTTTFSAPTNDESYDEGYIIASLATLKPDGSQLQDDCKIILRFASETEAGAMSAKDKAKLNKISDSTGSLLEGITQNGYITLKTPAGLITGASATRVTLNYHWTGEGDRTEYIDSATSTTAGLMSASDKKKLDNADNLVKEIDANGFITLKTNAGLITGVSENRITLNYHWYGNEDRTEYIPAATKTTAGLMTSSDKSKLDNLTASTFTITGYKPIPENQQMYEQASHLSEDDTLNKALQKLEYRIRELEKKVYTN